MLFLAAAALSAALPLDVPFLPQTPDLCGGAAAAMVLRYWGDAHAGVEPFAPLVDRKAGGIAAEALIAAVRRQGWNVESFAGTLDTIGEHLNARRPVIVLLRDRGDRFHYVVVTAVGANGMTVHDPSWGPSRLVRLDDFERRWREAQHWTLLITPKDGAVSDFSRTENDGDALVRLKAEGTSNRSDCDSLLEDAIAQVQARGVGEADVILDRVRAACPMASRPLSELSGVRFAQHRWADAVALAREALALDATDTYAIDVLGSSLFMLDDARGALEAWNRIGKPRLDAVRIDGLHRARYETIAGAIGARPNTILTPEAFALAERRMNELPDRTSARLTVRPSADGFATLDAVVTERAAVPHGMALWGGVGLRASVDREAALSVPGVGGEGDVWSASWRWWANRPRFAVGYAAPHVGRVRGVWRMDGVWEEETYAFGSRDAPAVVTERHAGGEVAVSDWITSRWRYAFATGFDAWNGERKTVSIGGSVDRRFAGDKVSLTTDAATWLPVAGGHAFHAIAVGLLMQSPMGNGSWAYTAGVGAERVSDAAPFGLWPGAGEGRARKALLRAHPLLDGGILDATTTAMFGRTLAHANAEMQRWLPRAGMVRIGVAGFADGAVAARRGFGASPLARVDAGAGLRIKLPATDRILRIDLAHGLADGANALTIGWIY